ncbi:MAG: peptidase S8, partial [Streptomyces sp.]|nr:peptidase S8 [Streptomyces sp.]
MTAPYARYRRAAAIPAGMAMATALAFLPNTAATAAEDASPAPAAAQADATPLSYVPLSYVVNVKPGHGTSAHVKKAVAKAGGTIVTSYDQIGVIVVHSSNADFAKTIRTVRGVQSAGATRTAPLPSASTGDLGAPKGL